MWRGGSRAARQRLRGAPNRQQAARRVERLWALRRSEWSLFEHGLSLMSNTPLSNSLLRAPIAAILAWLVPGLGHIFLGHKVRGLIFLVVITLTFWTGVAVGGVKCVDPRKPVQQHSNTHSQRGRARSWWFFAQIMNGGYAVATHAVGVRTERASYLSWPSGDIASVYTGVAGLLNLLIILDALVRAEGLALAAARASGPTRSTGPPKGGGST